MGNSLYEQVYNYTGSPVVLKKGKASDFTGLSNTNINPNLVVLAVDPRTLGSKIENLNTNISDTAEGGNLNLQLLLSGRNPVIYTDENFNPIMGTVTKKVGTEDTPIKVSEIFIKSQPLSERPSSNYFRNTLGAYKQLYNSGLQYSPEYTAFRDANNAVGRTAEAAITIYGLGPSVLKGLKYADPFHYARNYAKTWDFLHPFILGTKNINTALNLVNTAELGSFAVPIVMNTEDSDLTSSQNPTEQLASLVAGGDNLAAPLIAGTTASVLNYLAKRVPAVKLISKLDNIYDAANNSKVFKWTRHLIPFTRKVTDDMTEAKAVKLFLNNKDDWKKFTAELEPTKFKKMVADINSKDDAAILTNDDINSNPIIKRIYERLSPKMKGENLDFGTIKSVLKDFDENIDQINPQEGLKLLYKYLFDNVDGYTASLLLNNGSIPRKSFGKYVGNPSPNKSFLIGAGAGVGYNIFKPSENSTDSILSKNSELELPSEGKTI